MESIRLACEAMATRFEFLLYGPDASRLRAAGEEAIGEVMRLHDALSLFRPQSLVSRINRDAADRPVRVSAELVNLLEDAIRLSDITGHAFDPTVGPLLDLWGFRGEQTTAPSAAEVESVLDRIGSELIDVDRRNRSVAFKQSGMQIDLGGVGKGFALDTAASVLLYAGVECGLLHGGTSTALAIGPDVSGKPWRIAVPGIGNMSIEDEALSVSAPAGRTVEFDGEVAGHVLDPRSGYPVSGPELAVAVVPSATYADALATGLLILGEQGIETLDQHVVGFRGAVSYGNGRIYGKVETDKS